MTSANDSQPRSQRVQLNRAQRDAVTHDDGPLLVIAGAGTGKTRVITHRIARLISDKYADSSRIAAVTFTNKASREMRDRLTRLIGKDAVKDLWVSTFHRLGLRIINEHLEELELKKGFNLIDGRDAQVIVQDLARGELTSDPKFSERIQWTISSWKNDGISPTEAAVQLADNNPVHLAAVRVYPEYERRLRVSNSVDLDDLILKPARLLIDNPEIAASWRYQLRYLLVDEYQDTNAVQYELVRQIAGAGDGLMVVGDDDQSIYAWRGAKPENLARLSEDFSNLTVIKLEENYRSVGCILKAANAVIANNTRHYKKNLISHAGYGDSIRVTLTDDEHREAERVVSLLMTQMFTSRARHSDFAIIYRSNHQSRLLERKLREMRVPYRISGGQSFFDRAEVRDVLAYMRLIANPVDDNAFLRIINRPRRGIGSTSLERLTGACGERALSLSQGMADDEVLATLSARPAAALRQFAALAEGVRDRAMPSADGSFTPSGTQLAEAIEGLMTDSGYLDWIASTADDPDQANRRLENIEQLLEWVTDMARTGSNQGLSDILAQMLLSDLLDKQKDDDDRDEVSLLTLHAAKGLEFDHVYITGMEEGMLPHRNSIESDTIEEERRLFYVGITRARKTLTLSAARQRKRHGQIHQIDTSRFIEELPYEDINWDQTDNAGSSPDVAAAHLSRLRDILGQP